MKNPKSFIAVFTSMVFVFTQVFVFSQADSSAASRKETVSKTATVASGPGENKKEKEIKPVAIAGKAVQEPEFKKKKFPWLVVVAAVVVVGGVVAYLILKKDSTPKTGSISVNSNPTGAKIYLDGDRSKHDDERRSQGHLSRNLCPQAREGRLPGLRRKRDGEGERNGLRFRHVDAEHDHGDESRGGGAYGRRGPWSRSSGRPMRRR